MPPLRTDDLNIQDPILLLISECWKSKQLGSSASNLDVEPTRYIQTETARLVFSTTIHFGWIWLGRMPLCSEAYAYGCSISVCYPKPKTHLPEQYHEHLANNLVCYETENSMAQAAYRNVAGMLGLQVRKT